MRLRERYHRLRPQRKLTSVAEAKRFVREVGVATLMPGSGLPSLFGAAQGRPYKPGSRGFATWPRDQWWWGGVVAEARGVLYVKILAGRGVYVAQRLWKGLDTIVRYVLAELDAGRYRRFGVAPEAERLLEYLRNQGPTRTDILRRQLGYATPRQGRRFHQLKQQLEALGVVVGRTAKLEVHLHIDVLHRWDQYFPQPLTTRAGRADQQAFRGALEEFLYEVVDAGVVVPEDVAAKWFRWNLTAQRTALAELVERGKLRRVSTEDATFLTTHRWLRQIRT